MPTFTSAASTGVSRSPGLPSAPAEIGLSLAADPRSLNIAALMLLGGAEARPENRDAALGARVRLGMLIVATGGEAVGGGAFAAALQAFLLDIGARVATVRAGADAKTIDL